MLERQVVIPVSPEILWDALTQPDEVAGWFGARVEWELAPGGPARFHGDDGAERTGVVQSVLPGRHLRFQWWPTGTEVDGSEVGASEVTYDLEPDAEGTRLTITERPAPVPATPNTGSPNSTVPSDRASTSTSTLASASLATWTDWDSHLVVLWGMSGQRVPAGVQTSATA